MIRIDRICNRALFEWHHRRGVAPAANGIKKIFQNGTPPQSKQRQQQCKARGYERLLLSGGPNYFGFNAIRYPALRTRFVVERQNLDPLTDERVDACGARRVG